MELFYTMYMIYIGITNHIWASLTQIWIIPSQNIKTFWKKLMFETG